MNKGMETAICSLWTLAWGLPLGMVLVPALDFPPGEMVGQWIWLGKVWPWAVLCALAAWVMQERKRKAGVLSSSQALLQIRAGASWSLFLLGVAEAVWGLAQLFGWLPSGHSFYAVTGSFANPGPYGGYIALSLAVAFDGYFYHRGGNGPCMSRAWRKAACSLLMAGGLLMLLALSASHSRSAWIAAAVACGWAYTMRTGRVRLSALWNRHRRRCVAVLAGGVLVAVVLAAGLYMLKPDSALGRLFMWKMTCRAIAESPWIGIGRLRFAEAYSQAQMQYFSAGGYEPWEERVAGSPEYAFNEYLELLLAGGIFLLTNVLLAVVLAWKLGKAHSWGLRAGLLVVLVFAFSSYPLHVPGFFVAAVVLVSVLIAPARMVPAAFVAFGLVLLLGPLPGRWQQRKEACKEWAVANMLYRTGAYRAAVKAYGPLRDVFRWEGRFLYEYGYCLYKIEQNKLAYSMLMDSTDFLTDPMPYNVIGQLFMQYADKQEGDFATVNYMEAENYLQMAADLLPGRIYPYYLQAKLYARPRFLHPDKFREACRKVLYKPPKVHSTAIEQMRDEVRALMKRMEKKE